MVDPADNGSEVAEAPATDPPPDWVWDAIDKDAPEPPLPGLADKAGESVYGLGPHQPGVVPYGQLRPLPLVAGHAHNLFGSEVSRDAEWHPLIHTKGLRINSFSISEQQDTAIDAALHVTEKSLCGKHDRLLVYRALSVGRGDDLQAVFYRSAPDLDGQNQPVGFAHLLLPIYHEALAAIDRASRLLWRMLRPVQQHELANRNGFTVEGSAGGRFFLKRRDTHSLDELLPDGSVKANWCLTISPGEWMPTDDIVLAQKYAVETDEPRFRKIAIRRLPGTVRRFDSWVQQRLARSHLNGHNGAVAPGVLHPAYHAQPAALWR